MRAHGFAFWTVPLILLLALAAAHCGGGDDDDNDAAAGDDDFADDDGAADDDDDNDDDNSNLTFPDGFLFGAATSGFQVEMGCPTLAPEKCVDANSDWYQFVTSPETANDRLAFVADGNDPAVVGPGQWELFAADFDLAAHDVGHNAYRLSLEWSRILPTSTEGVEGYENLRAIANDDAVQHYHQVFAALKAEGLTPLVTLDHYTLPTWIHDGVGCHVDFASCSPRGWLDRDRTVTEIAKYAGFVAREYGGEVDLWTTLNEPLAVLLAGYLLPNPTRSNPPAVFFRFDEFKTAMTAMIEAHARMVDAVRANDEQDADSDGVAEQVGIVYAMSPVIPKNPDRELDRQAADNLFYLWNLAFLNAVALGQLDENLDGAAEFRQDLAGRLDFLGLNYYARITVSGLSFSLVPWFTPLLTINPLDLRIDEIYPRGIWEMTEYANQQLGVPVYVTENNARSDPNDDAALEERSLVEHLSWLWWAIQEGADVRGYFYWSLIDNIEWNQGPKPYGLYAVDINDPNKPRSPRELVAIYREITAAHGIPPDLSAQYPVDFR
jgi:beta-glucosidase/6-phospho-beta-glucosidase/beta-galactosidase